MILTLVRISLRIIQMVLRIVLAFTMVFYTLDFCKVPTYMCKLYACFKIAAITYDMCILLEYIIVDVMLGYILRIRYIHQIHACPVSFY